MLPEWFPGWDFTGGFQGRLVVAVLDNTFGPKGRPGSPRDAGGGDPLAKMGA